MNSEIRDSPTADPRCRNPTPNRKPVLEIVVIVGIAAVAIASAALGGAPVIVTVAVVLAAAFGAFLVLRSNTEQQRLLQRLHRQHESEIDQWQMRWQSLQQEAQQTTSALSLMRDGVIMLSGSSEILLINPASRRLLTLSPEQELLGRSLVEVVRIPDLSQALSAARSGDGTQKVLLEISDGEIVRPVKVRVDRVTTAGETNLLVTLRDETVAHRLDEMRREFIANISHEIKTPLAAIKGYAETVELAINDDPGAAVHFMGQINSQCLRLERLVSDMMQLAKAQAGRGQLNFSPVCMQDVIDKAMESYRPVAEAKNIELTVAASAIQAQVWSDPEATLTIANNLIGNAIRYTPEGGKVRVWCRQAGKFWALVVEDTGVGIPASEQKRIFERFYRLQRSRHEGNGGTGIGLSIVKNLTNTLGGEVRVSSKPGQGSIFEVLLPTENSSQGHVSNQEPLVK